MRYFVSEIFVTYHRYFNQKCYLFSLQLWNTVNEGSIGVYRGHSGWVHCVALSQDASKLVSSSDDETVKVKHYEAQKCSIFKG